MIELITTEDGSSSLFNPELRETYHSRHGALRESQHVFIQEGLEKKSDLTHVRILEVGMGTGLNVLLTALYALQCQQHIQLTTLEPFPVDKDLLEKVNYASLIEGDLAPSIFNRIHESEWGIETEINAFFKLTKLKMPLEKLTSELKFDLIYYDAFGPHAQPELWEANVFSHLATFCESGSTLVTYCAQGQFKRNLKAAGFSVERLPGPPGKREMTRGTFGV